MANKSRRPISQPIGGSGAPALGGEIPAWLDRIRLRLRSTRPDAVRKVFLERAFEAIIEITQTLPSSALEEPAAAGNNVLVLLKALQSPEILPELERYEPLASPYLKGVEAQRELIKQSGGLMSSEEVARLLGLTRQAVDKRRQSNKLIALPQGQRGFGYPSCQFDSHGPLHGLEEMLNTLQAADGWMQLTYLLSANTDLGNRSPLELLREGHSSAVVEASGKFGEHGAL